MNLVKDSRHNVYQYGLTKSHWMSHIMAQDLSTSSSPKAVIIIVLIVIILLSAINSCLMLIVFLLIKRLRQVRACQDMDSTRDYYQVSQDDSILKKPKLITNNTYSEIDIYSASSGFVSEDGSTKDQERIDTIESCPVNRQSGALQEAFYETAESVRLKKYQLKEAYHKNDLTVEKAMQSIDETMKMLQVTAEKL